MKKLTKDKKIIIKINRFIHTPMLTGGLEPPPYDLQKRCSTDELCQLLNAPSLHDAPIQIIQSHR